MLNTPFAEILPPLSREEYDALAADIDANGVQTPIVIDEDNNILDGHHRYKICPDAPVRTIDGLTHDEKIAYVLLSNLTRRNLSPAQRKEITKTQKKLAKELNKTHRYTQEKIALLLGVNQKTVSNWLTNNSKKDNVGKTDEKHYDARVTLPAEVNPEIVKRIEAGESQAQIAADLAVSQQTISNRYNKEKEKEKKIQAQEQLAITFIPEPTFHVEYGQVWQLGDHRLMCCDSYCTEHLDRLVNGSTINALITDPPYGIDYQPDWDKWDGSPGDFPEVIGDKKKFDPQPFLDYPTVVMFGANYFSDCLPVGSWICWDKRGDVEKDAMFGSPFELAWFKSAHTNRQAIMIRVLHGGVVNADSKIGNNEKRLHTTQKPIAVMSQIIEATTAENETILDPFCGSGSTLLACEPLKRKCFAMEIDTDYVAIILQRWYENTGIKPCLVS